MSSLIVQVNDSSKVKLIKELLMQYDFIEIYDDESIHTQDISHNLLDFKGLWNDYQISGDELRKSAWKRK